MLTVTEIPSSIVLAKNPVVFRFQITDEDGAPYGPKGASAEATFESGAFADGETIDVEWTYPDGISQIVTFVARPTPSGINEVQDDPATLADVQAIAAKMQAHYQIAPYFALSATEPSMGTFVIRIDTIETTNDWTVAFDVSGLSGTTSATSAAAEADNAPDGLELLMDVYFEETYGSGDFTLVAELSERPDSAGNLAFNISHILAAEAIRTLSDPPIPSFTEEDVTIADNLRQYYVRYRQNYDDIVASPLNFGDNIWQYLGTQKVLCGGISQNLYADYNFFATLSASNSLLTWYPDGKTVSIEQPEFLPWINYTGEQKTVLLELRRYTATSTTPLSSAFLNAGTVEAWETALLPCGYTQANIVSDTVVKYTVRVVDGASDYEGGAPEYLSQLRTFYVDYDYHIEERYLMYLNGFCAPMTLRCIGNFTNELEVERQETTKILPPDYTSTTAEQQQYAYDYDNYFTYRSGYLSRQEVDALQELAIYNHLWEVYEEGYIPLLIKNNNFLITETRQQLHSMEIVTVPALKARSFSNVSIPMEAEQEGWRTSFDSFWKTVFGLTWKIAP